MNAATDDQKGSWVQQNSLWILKHIASSIRLFVRLKTPDGVRVDEGRVFYERMFVPSLFPSQGAS